MSVAITQTANPSGVSASSNVATYSGVSIGTAASNRIVVVLVGTEFTSASIDSVTLGGQTMTAGDQGNQGGVYARAFYLAYPTGTTADIVVTFGANPGNTQNHIAVYRVTGAVYASKGSHNSTDMDSTSPLTTGSISIAEGGGFIAVAACATDNNAKAWANATEDIDADVGELRFTTATRTTALTTTAVTCTGTSNGEDGALSWLIFTTNDRYWIGGTGNWSDKTHWAISSGGVNTPIAIDSYSESNYSNEFLVAGSTWDIQVGQSFTGNGNVLDNIVLKIRKSGSPTGSCFVRVYAHAGTFGTSSVPTGGVLAQSDNFDISTLTTTSTLKTFQFSGVNKITLTNNTKYVWVVRYEGGNSSNYLRVQIDDTSPTHGGNAIQTTSAAAGVDICFYVNQLGETNIPTSSDNVFIDANSGFGAGGTITFDPTLFSSCNNLTSNSGHTYTITSLAGRRLEVYGSVSLESGLTYSVSGLFFKPSENVTVNANGATLNTEIRKYESGTLTLTGNLTNSQNFDFYKGTFDADIYNITASSFRFYSATGSIPTVNMGSGTWEVTGTLGVIYGEESNSESIVINAETSTIKITDASATRKFIYIADTTDWSEVGKAFYNLWFTGAGTGALEVNGSNSFNDFKVDNPPHTVKFQQGTTTTVATFTVSGTSGNLITIDSVDGATQHVLSKSSGTVECEYLDISNSTATGGATWIAKHSIDSGNNTGWIFGEPAFVTKSTLLLTDGTDTTWLGHLDTADELNFTSNEVTVEATFDGFAHFDTVSQLLFIDKDHTISSPQSWGQVNRSNSGWIETPSTTTTWNQTTSNSTPWQ